MNSFILIKPGKYKNVWFESSSLPFVCKGNITLINCKCNNKLFCMGSLIAFKSEFTFLDVAKKVYTKLCRVNDHLSSCDESYLINTYAKNVTVIGNLKIAQAEIHNLKIYSGMLKHKGNNKVDNYNLSEEVPLETQLSAMNKKSCNQFL